MSTETAPVAAQVPVERATASPVIPVLLATVPALVGGGGAPPVGIVAVAGFAVLVLVFARRHAAWCLLVALPAVATAVVEPAEVTRLAGVVLLPAVALVWDRVIAGGPPGAGEVDGSMRWRWPDVATGGPDAALSGSMVLVTVLSVAGDGWAAPVRALCSALVLLVLHVVAPPAAGRDLHGARTAALWLVGVVPCWLAGAGDGGGVGVAAVAGIAAAAALVLSVRVPWWGGPVGGVLVAGAQQLVSGGAIAVVAGVVFAVAALAAEATGIGSASSVGAAGIDTVVRWGGALRAAVRRVDRGAMGGARRVAAWFAAVRPHNGESSPDEAVDGLGRGWRALLVRYRTPIGWWLVGWYVTQKVARFANALYLGLPVDLGWIVSPDVFHPAGRIAWGTGDYYKVARDGYRLGEALEAIFPVNVLLIRAVHRVTGVHLVTSQLVIAAIAGLAATMLLWRWLLARRVRLRERRIVLALFLTYPWCFMVFGIPYSDVLLVALVLAAFLAVELGRPITAGVVGAVATATRPNAVPLVAGLVVDQLQRAQVVTWVRSTAGGRARSIVGWVREHVEVRPSRLRPAQAAVLLSALGVAAYSVWLVGHAGNPLYWISAQGSYGHGSITDLAEWVKTGFLTVPEQSIDTVPTALNELGAFLALVSVALLVPAVARRVGWGYAAFVVGVWLISWVGPRNFAPAGRYLIQVVPFAALATSGWLVDRPRVLRPLLVLSVAGSLAATAAFATGIWAEW